MGIPEKTDTSHLMLREMTSFLESMFINPKSKWVGMMLEEGVSNKRELFEIFLNTDIRETSELSGLSMNFMKPKYFLERPVILQVNEVVDVSLRKDRRFKMDERQSPTLKLLLSDGDRMIGVAQRHIPGIAVGCAGVKVKIDKGTVMRYGVFVLNEENTEFLGGRSDAIVSLVGEQQQLNSEETEFETNIESAMKSFREDFNPCLAAEIMLPALPQTLSNSPRLWSQVNHPPFISPATET